MYLLFNKLTSMVEKQAQGIKVDLKNVENLKKKSRDYERYANS